MNVDKAKKRILKRVQRGFKGYPQISLEYFGKTTDLATEVVITFLPEENAEPQIQRFTSDKDARCYSFGKARNISLLMVFLQS
ncbi:hypothetical protein ACP3XC_00060 [Vibrio anguillarum]|uniref:hypothetical protein n=1 Tax=Vibrio anguillarum TaxID=55601 RepID=UPI003CF7BD6C